MTTTIKTPEEKRFILSLIQTEDLVDAQGNKIARTTYPKNHYLPTMNVIEKIHSSRLVCLTMDGKEWHKHSDISKQEMAMAKLEKYDEQEITFEADEVKAIKFYWNERQELPKMDNASIFKELQTKICG